MQDKKKLTVDSLLFHNQLFFRFLQDESAIQRSYGICANLVCGSLTQYCHTLRFSWTRWIPEWSDEPVSPAFPELPLRWTRGSQY